MRAPVTRPCTGSVAGPSAAVFPRQCQNSLRQRATPQRHLTKTSVAALENPATRVSTSLSNGAAQPLEFEEVHPSLLLTRLHADATTRLPLRKDGHRHPPSDADAPPQRCPAALSPC
jgi:hypothetical protein